MSDVVCLTIDGRSIAVHHSASILDAVRAAGISLPTLCHCDGLSAAGACRLCSVEVEGIPRLLPACATRASEGMTVITRSPRLERHRQMILELLFAERNHVCATCVSNGHCELQSLARDLGVTHSRFAYRFPALSPDASHPRFVFDPNRCVLCTRCVRACEEIEGARTWAVSGRGILSGIVADLDCPWGDSETCTSCGKCVQVCPTGALFEKGRATGEMTKCPDLVPRLVAARARTR